MSGPQIAWLPDGKRLHMNHGPIDLVVDASGPETERRLAYAQAAERFDTILEELVAELPGLRSPCRPDAPRVFVGSTARRMEAACLPFARDFVTPMASVAGAVADEMLAALVAGRRLERAFVNDGGDIAIHLAPGHKASLAIAGTGRGFSDRAAIGWDSPVRGIATSGWRGRSHSLGIADAVTVLARTAAAADAAATMIANAVCLPAHPAIRRAAARTLSPDSDLGERLVTVDVGNLASHEIAQALANGAEAAEDCRRRGLVEAAALFLKGETRVCGTRSIRQDLLPVADRSDETTANEIEETHA